MGFIPFSYYQENLDELKALEIDGGSGCIAPTVENVQAGVNTLVPFFKFKHAKANKQADEPELTKTPNFFPNNFETLFSNSTVLGPKPAIQPSLKQETTA
jgi:phosphate transport system substrate-binding protein